MKRDISSAHDSLLQFEFTCDRPTLCNATVVIPKSTIDHLYHETALTQQHSIATQGFKQGNVPLEYIEQNFKNNITEHLKEFLFKYCVINFLYKEIRTRKILVAGEPRLLEITLEPHQDARFSFEFSVFPSISIHEWKYFPFKAPKRKNYKDLDRQVDNFIKDERLHLENTENEELSLSDWVNFDIILVDKNNKPLVEPFTQNLWLKLGNKEIEGPLQNLFIKKKKGDEFYTTNRGLQEHFSGQLNTSYNFHVKIADVLPHNYFCFDQFKRNFRIKTNKDMHKKLIEVFSYRNDISQRLAMVQEMLKLLLSKHRFIAPKQLILRQQKEILSAIQKNPDYNVYRKQRDFRERVEQLAEKQIKETWFVDQLAHHENVQMSLEDTKGYLNLSKRARMKDFIYFDLPITKQYGQEMPIPAEKLNRICIREKAINHAIYHLTKK